MQPFYLQKLPHLQEMVHTGFHDGITHSYFYFQYT